MRCSVVLVALSLVACPTGKRRKNKDAAGQEEGIAVAPRPARSLAEIRRDGNHLVGEPSPYLRQHAHNPVDWYPWGDEALQRAKRENKPIFLSVGYSTCHWCHVMEEESFEDDEVAAFLNESFVSIKVDREQRPDVDSLYIDAVGALGGSTGWPLTVFLTPDLEPFFGGTYYPRHPSRGRPGFLDILNQVLRIFREEGSSVGTRGRQILEAVRRRAAASTPVGQVRVSLAREAIQRLAPARDMNHGGFGKRQKFPNVPLLHAELMHVEATGDEIVERHLTLTLDEMLRGGVRDHLSGTFHRYAVDSQWHIPHFEKTLYDNAQLAGLYVRAGRSLDRPDWIVAGRAVLDDLIHSWQQPDGGLVVGFDADDPGGEGAFYTWTPGELNELLGPDDGRMVAGVFGVTSHGEPGLGGRSVLHRASPESVPARLRLSGSDVERGLERAFPLMREARNTRPPPAVDDKELVAWNGLALVTLANVGRWLEEPRYVEAAAKVGRFVMDRAWDSERRVMARGLARGRSLGDGFLDDYALSGLGLLRLHAATGDLAWLGHARLLADVMVERHWDADQLVFYTVAADRAGASVPVRKTDLDDGVLPSGGTAAIRFLLELGAIAGDRALYELAHNAVEASAGRVRTSPYSSGFMMSTVEHAASAVREVVVVGPLDHPGTRRLWDEVRGTTFSRVLPVRLPPSGALAGEAFPALQDKVMLRDQPTAYVCEQGRCERPTADPAVLRRQLQRALAG